MSLHDAASKSDVPRIEAAVAGGSSPNERNEKGETPLHVASHAGAHASVHALLRVGADAAVADAHGRTALHLVAEAGNRGLLQALLPNSDLQAKVRNHAAVDAPASHA